MRPGPGLVVMVLAFFTGARPTNTFSSRDYDRRQPPLLLLSALSQPSTPSPPPPAPSIPTSSPYSIAQPQHNRRATATVDLLGAFLGFRARRSADTSTEGGGAVGSSSGQDESNPHKQQPPHRTRLRSTTLSSASASLAQDQIKPSLFSDFFSNYPPIHNRAATATDTTGSSRPQTNLHLVQLTDSAQHSQGTSTTTEERERGVAAPPVAASQLKALVEDDQGLTGGALARINPWLSACDLAQPNTAPDLQGQCTAGKLPVAWVDEGPGPPVCPENCGTLKEQSNYEKRFNLNVVNSPSMDNNSTISGDSHKTRDSRKTNKRGRGDMCDDIRNPHPAQQHQHQSLTGAMILDPSGGAVSGGGVATTTTTTIQMIQTREEVQPPKEKTTIPCLDCLGDSPHTRPAHICRSANIKADLKRLRLRHCCERDLYTALHGRALEEVLAGGEPCERQLTDLMQTDALATRITCEFTEILVRYDCRQMYSIIHHCEDCKEAYRRWVCSTLIPYFDYADRDRPTYNKDSDATRRAGATTTNVAKRSVPAEPTTPPATAEVASSSVSESKMTIVDNSSDTKKRSRRKSNPEKIRTRIRPCLSVCQTVEQKCPYLLPGDRAPAHPTQYAGEPTFLCLDPNIPETGEQKIKSNHGPEHCCYEYCENRRLCARCHWNDTTVELTSKLDGDSTHVSLGEINSEIEVVATLEYYRDDAYPIETSQCAVIHVVPSEGISTVRTSVLPNTKCPIPYYIGELPGDKEAAAAAAAASAGHRSISGFHAYLYVIFMWLLLASYHYLVSPLEQVYELELSADPTSPALPCVA